MAWPSYEDITVELIRRLQVALGADVDVYGGEGGAIEVVAADGSPTVEVQDKLKLQVSPPDDGPAEEGSQPFGERIMVSKDTTSPPTSPNYMTYVDAPAPDKRDLTFKLLGWGTHELTLTGGQKGVIWLKHQITRFIQGWFGGPTMLGVGWPSDFPVDHPAWQGYFFDGTGPKTVPGQSADLHAFSATVTVRDVFVSDDTNGTGPLVGPASTTPYDGSVEVDILEDPDL